MKGYIRNKTSGWRHAMKRSIGPGHKIALDELYEQYGEKHSLEPGEPFIDWLKNVKLRDRNTWDIVIEKEVIPEEVEETKAESDAKNKNAEKSASYQTPFVRKEIEIDDIINMTVRNARVELKKITNLRTLRIAYEQARQLSHKDTLCQYLRRRIQELELTRR